MRSKIVGAIFPIPYRFLDRFFKEGKDVFVKYPTVFKQLERGMKLLFYASHEVKAIVGEGTINNFLRLSPSEIHRRYKDRLFLSEKELKEYVKGGPFTKRKSKEFLVIELKAIKQYNTPVKPKRFVTVAGEYLTEDRYHSILLKQNRRV